jgi:hypothetical protein
MPYTEEELQDNEHYSSIKERDEIKYHDLFLKTNTKFLDNDGNTKDTLLDKNDVIQLFENPTSGETYDDENQYLYVQIYQRRYRTKKKTLDFIDREFKEF